MISSWNKTEKVTYTVNGSSSRSRLRLVQQREAEGLYACGVYRRSTLFVPKKTIAWLSVTITDIPI
jgi:hypothetical protein